MSKVTVSLGPFQVSAVTLRNIICSPFRQLAGTPRLSRKVDDLRVHVSAMTDILHIVVAGLADSWSPEQRERVQRAIARFTVVNTGLSNIKLQQNPFTASEVQRLHVYTRQAEQGESFLADEARDFKELSERVAHEYADQDWVAELLKVAFFIFAIYALSELLKPHQKQK